jgi:hypothetical protein
VILLEAPNETYWREWLAFVTEELIGRGLCSPEDLALVEMASSIADAVRSIERFYANYHSARYVGERLILRMRRAPAKQQLARLNAEFADVLDRGRIERVGVTPAESRENDAVEMARIGLYPRHNFGRLRQLIDALNGLG